MLPTEPSVRIQPTGQLRQCYFAFLSDLACALQLDSAVAARMISEERVELDEVSIRFRLESELTDGAGIGVELDIGKPRRARESAGWRLLLERNRMTRPPYLACNALERATGSAIIRAFFPLAMYSAAERAALLLAHVATARALRREIGAAATLPDTQESHGDAGPRTVP